LRETRVLRGGREGLVSQVLIGKGDYVTLRALMMSMTVSAILRLPQIAKVETNADALYLVLITLASWNTNYYRDITLLSEQMRSIIIRFNA